MVNRLQGCGSYYSTLLGNPTPEIQWYLSLVIDTVMRNTVIPR